MSLIKKQKSPSFGASMLTWSMTLLTFFSCLKITTTDSSLNSDYNDINDWELHDSDQISHDCFQSFKLPKILDCCREFAMNNGTTLYFNKPIDDNMDLIRKVLLKFDPLTLFDNEIDATVVTVHLYSGLLYNISKLQRFGDCILTYDNSILTFKWNIEWEELFLNYKFLALLYEGNLYGRFKKINTNIVMAVDLKNHKIILKRLNIVIPEQEYIWIEAAGESFVNFLITLFLPFARNVIRKTVTNSTTFYLSRTIDKLNEILGIYRFEPFTFVVKTNYSLGNDSHI